MTQLQLLHARFRPSVQRIVWVTPGTLAPHAEFGSDVVVESYHPTTRHLFNAMRNLELARRIVQDYVVCRLVTTGAGLAVPFALVASRERIPVHYIESATRIRGPSLSARMIEHLPYVQCYTQHSSWQRRGWLYRGSVFDGYHVDQTPSQDIETIFVSFGTHQYPFTALVDRLLQTVPSDVHIVWQLGSTPAPSGIRGDVCTILSPMDQNKAIGTADVVVGHAGTGLTLSALEAGKTPLLVPRRSEHGEHIDDHQSIIAREYARNGIVVATSVDRLDWAAIVRASRGRVTRRANPPVFRLAESSRS